MIRLNTTISHALAAIALVGAVALTGQAFAASGGMAATPVATGGTARAVPLTQVEKRISDLHAKLHITAAQEPQWAAVARVMRDNAVGMDTLIKERSANAKAMSAVDDLRSYEKLAEAHEDGLKNLIPVFQSLYDSMSDEQKRNADVAFRSHEMRTHNKRT